MSDEGRLVRLDADLSFVDLRVENDGPVEGIANSRPLHLFEGNALVLSFAKSGEGEEMMESPGEVWLYESPDSDTGRAASGPS